MSTSEKIDFQNYTMSGSEKVSEKKAPSLDLFQARSIALSDSTDRTASFVTKRHGHPSYDEDQIGPTDDVEASHTLDNIKANHKWDPNLPSSIEEEIEEATMTTDTARRLSIVESIVNNSPYPEVRAAVRNVPPPLFLSPDLFAN